MQIIVFFLISTIEKDVQKNKYFDLVENEIVDKLIKRIIVLPN